jgi:hypothetical protein
MANKDRQLRSQDIENTKRSKQETSLRGWPPGPSLRLVASTLALDGLIGYDTRPSL